MLEMFNLFKITEKAPEAAQRFRVLLGSALLLLLLQTVDIVDTERQRADWICQPWRGIQEEGLV